MLSIPPLVVQTPSGRYIVVVDKDKVKEGVEVSSPTLVVTRSSCVYQGVCIDGKRFAGV